MARFQVGQQVTFIHVKFTSNQPRFNNIYLPWCDTLNEVKVKVLTCAEHHLVAGEWDNEIRYDGFIFHDTENDDHPWFNQYPRAAYDQISTEQDYMVHKGYRDVKEVESWEIENGDFDDYTEVSVYINHAMGGIRDLKKLGLTQEAASMQTFCDSLITKIAELGAQITTTQRYGRDRIEVTWPAPTPTSA